MKWEGREGGREKIKGDSKALTQVTGKNGLIILGKAVKEDFFCPGERGDRRLVWTF